MDACIVRRPAILPKQHVEKNKGRRSEQS